MKISRVGCFGKIPTQGDFIRHHAEPFTFAGLDRWLQEGLATLGRTGVELHPARFLFLAGDAVLGGVLVPSRDRVGRRFPLAVFVVLAEVRELAALAPLLLGEFMAAAEAVADVAVRGMDITALRQHIDSLRGVISEEDARSTRDAYCANTTMRAFAADVLGHDDVGVIEQWLTNFVAALGNEDPPRYAVRSVIVDQGPWLAAWSALLGAVSRHRIQLACWERVLAAGVSSCRVLFDGLHARYAPAMLNPRAEGDLVFDATPRTDAILRPGAQHERARGVLGDGASSVAACIARARRA